MYLVDTRCKHTWCHKNQFLRIEMHKTYFCLISARFSISSWSFTLSISFCSWNYFKKKKHVGKYCGFHHIEQKHWEQGDICPENVVTLPTYVLCVRTSFQEAISLPVDLHMFSSSSYGQWNLWYITYFLIFLLHSLLVFR